MTDDRQDLAIEGIRFFGEMCASVSHEIKNVLAIINENAGLLGDMVGMAEKGMPLAPERLLRVAQSIARQVTRGDGIVKGLNQFAHSADRASESVDVGELLRFMVNLAGRRIAMKGNMPQIQLPDGAVTATTNRFFLENLIWHGLYRALEACPAEGTVLIVVEKSAQQVHIRFCGLAEDALNECILPLPPEAIMVATFLGARWHIDKEKGEIHIILP